MRDQGVLIVGFTGKAGSGKTTVAKAATRKVFSFAGYLKEIAKELGWKGEKDKKGRRLLQHLGDVGREYMPNIWIKALHDEILYQLMDDKYYGDISIYSIDDVRFDNECDFIHSNGGIIINLEHNNINLDKSLDNHISEQGVSKKNIDYTIPWDDLEIVVNKARTIVTEEYGKYPNTLRTS